MHDDKTFILRGGWETCCVKKANHSAFGVIISPAPPVIIYLRGDNPADDFKTLTVYDDVDAMLADGWMVD